MASRLAKSGNWVQFKTDAELFSGVLADDYVVIGADSVLRDGVLNKVGTRVLAQQAKHIGASVWILTDTTKFWPETYMGFLGRSIRSHRPGTLRTIWKQAPRGVDASYTSVSLFDHTCFDSRMRFLSERGWMTPAQVRREIAKIKLSPRLKELVD